MSSNIIDGIRSAKKLPPCPECGASRNERTESASKKHMWKGFLLLIKEGGEGHSGKLLNNNRYDGNMFQKLHYFGLIEPWEERNKGPQRTERGWWRVTKLGWKFYKGTASIPKKVIVYRNEVVAESETQFWVSDMRSVVNG